MLFVGAGPACLAGAVHLADLVKTHNAQVESSGSGARLEPAVAVIERAPAHPAPTTMPMAASSSSACTTA